jgi:hypothetical protein
MASNRAAQEAFTKTSRHQPKGKAAWRRRIAWLLGLIVLAWYSLQLLQARQRESVRQEIELLGGRVEVEPAPATLASWLMNPRRSDRVTAVVLANLQRFDSTLATTFPDLETLSLFNVPVTVQNLEDLQKLPRLRTLNLLQSHFEGQELRRLAQLPQLEELRMTEATDASLAQLAGCNELRTLRLFSSLKVTDRGLAKLPALPKLEQLQLVQTSITPAGVQAFKERHPNVEVRYQGDR